jgi:hypothetical protein
MAILNLDFCNLNERMKPGYIQVSLPSLSKQEHRAGERQYLSFKILRAFCILLILALAKPWKQTTAHCAFFGAAHSSWVMGKKSNFS